MYSVSHSVLAFAHENPSFLFPVSSHVLFLTPNRTETDRSFKVSPRLSVLDRAAFPFAQHDRGKDEPSPDEAGPDDRNENRPDVPVSVPGTALADEQVGSDPSENDLTVTVPAAMVQTAVATKDEIDSTLRNFETKPHRACWQARAEAGRYEQE